MISRFLLYFNTLKHLKPIQIYGRIYSKFKKHISVYNLPALKSTPAGINNKTTFINHEPWNSSENIKDNKFTFLNATHSFGNNINWFEKSLPLLWMFNLHYFGYLHLLDKSEQEKIVNDWIVNNQIGTSPGWHPYPLSLRIVNWIKADIKSVEIDRVLYKQCAYLYRNLEFYHPANHYLENAKALIFAGVYFKSNTIADKWYRKGLSIYRKHFPKMILNDGCFFELSPMYHLIILEGILDILNIIGKDTKEYKFFKEYAEKMAGFLSTIKHPDGELVLFNDSTLEIAPSPQKISEYAAQLGVLSKAKTSSLKNGSGIFHFINKEIFIVIDGGKLGPDNVPAHSHADIFSYELSYKGKKFIVDSGVYEYTAGEMRDYCRSTKVHNTVCIDNINQAEMWGTFRVARRYEPYNVKFNATDGTIMFEGEFDGYSRLIGDNIVHKRNIEINKNKFEINFEDEITGSGNHLVESFIHLHPDVEINKFDDCLILSLANISFKLSIYNSKFLIEDGWYCPEFGKRIRNKVIRIYSNNFPVNIVYKLYL